MNEFVERRPYFAEGPIALIIGCGDMGMACARALGRRRRLLIADIDVDRLSRAVTTLESEGYIVSGRSCNITDEVAVEALGRDLSNGPGVAVLAHVAAVGNTPGGWRVVLD